MGPRCSIIPIRSFHQIKAGDSENDQPNDNGFNALIKAKYNDTKSEWDQRYVFTKYTPLNTNQVLVETWRKVTLCAAKVIITSFEITKILPLRPPTNDEFTESACVASLQIGTGQKATELAILKEEKYMNSLSHENTNRYLHIIRSTNNNNRNLLIR